MQIELHYDHRTFGNSEDAKKYAAVLSTNQGRITARFAFPHSGVIGRTNTIGYASGIRSAVISLSREEATRLAGKLLELTNLPDGSTLHLEIAA